MIKIPLGACPAPAAPSNPAALAEHEVEILTEIELRQRERQNLLAALNQTGWRIKGPHGASELLGVKPTTLLFRIKKMGLRRP